MQTIAFHSNQLSMTGTEVALYDYALHNEQLLGNRSFILYRINHPNNHPQALGKFKDRFEVIGYERTEDLDRILEARHADLLYAIKAGKRDGIVSSRVPTMVHAVFPTSPNQVHGQSFAFISEWLSTHCSNGRVPCVPHMIDLPPVEGDCRQALGIPASALVVGCHGASGSFNVPCAIEAVRLVLARRTDVFFVFLNIAKFLDHPRAHFLPGTTDVIQKTRFIDTCDVMLHARLLGESFGLACGEFSVRNKPVLTYAYCKHTHHHDVLGNKGFYYRDTETLATMIQTWDRQQMQSRSWDRYSERYNPSRVMEQFDRHLIQPALTGSDASSRYGVGWRETLAFWQFKLRMHKGRLAQPAA